MHFVFKLSNRVMIAGFVLEGFALPIAWGRRKAVAFHAGESFGVPPLGGLHSDRLKAELRTVATSHDFATLSASTAVRNYERPILHETLLPPAILACTAADRRL